MIIYDHFQTFWLILIDRGCEDSLRFGFGKRVICASTRLGNRARANYLSETTRMKARHVDEMAIRCTSVESEDC
jgi:hypothetical protein